MTRKTKQIILITVITAIAAALVTGYLQWNKPHRNVKGAEALGVLATDLYKSFTADSAKANALYANKVLEVSGEVAKSSSNQQDQQIIFLNTGIPGAFINCTMEEKISVPKTGDHIVIKAICSGYISGDADMGLPGDVFLTRGYSSN